MPPSEMGIPPLSVVVDPSGLPESVAPVSVVEESVPPPPSSPPPSLPDMPESLCDPVAPPPPPPEHAAAIKGTRAMSHWRIPRLYAGLHRDAGGVMFTV